ncbi:MAG: redox-regulated ATPase YchF [Candidatus Handelsmanbacteria bacterium]|nr:redox-regulated ATPase YchF [Candidatus Handelsmanbacteria bacterium]
MKLGLVGYPQVGKRSLFRLLTGQELNKAGVGLARVRDPRFDWLVELYQPAKNTPAQLEFALIPDLEEQGNAEALKGLEKVDVVCHLIRAFADEAVFHLAGSVDPRRDLGRLEEELHLADLLFIEKRSERLQKERKLKGEGPKAKQEEELLGRFQAHLEGGHPLRTLSLHEEEARLIASYPFLTLKPLLLVLNLGEDQMGDTGLIGELREGFAGLGCEWVAVSAQIEEELAQLDPEERHAFLAELSQEEPALDRLTRVCYQALGLISFFTVGADEVRAWTIRRGALAPQAGRVIHSDIERGFIRAEVMKYADLHTLGSEHKVKEAGRWQQKGRDYLVEDGDIFHFLFKV